MPTEHALLSPSAAHRWLRCAPSARLEAGVPDEGTDYTREGTLAHAMAASSLKMLQGTDDGEEKAVIRELAPRHNSMEMREAALEFSRIVWDKYREAREAAPDALLLVERRLDLSDYIPGGFGTSDAVIVSDGTMEVLDFKYGKGVPVASVNNPQMMIYALGAYKDNELGFDIRRIRMTIVQPRIGNTSEWATDPESLLLWGETVLKPAAALAYKGEGGARAGDWCRFCRAKALCPALRETAAAAARLDVRLLTDEEVARDVLPMVPVVRTWLAAVEDWTLSRALAGTRYKGFKLVEGRGVRRVTDTAGAAAALAAAGFADVWKERELRTLTELERMVGRKAFDSLCSPYITKTAGKPALVPEDDRRPEITPAQADFASMEG